MPFKKPFDIVVVLGEDSGKVTYVHDAITKAKEAGKHCLLIGDGKQRKITPEGIGYDIEQSDGYIDSSTHVYLGMHGDDTQQDKGAYRPNCTQKYLRKLAEDNPATIQVFSCHAGVIFEDKNLPIQAPNTTIIAHGSRKYSTGLAASIQKMARMITEQARGVSLFEQLASYMMRSPETFYLSQGTKITTLKKPNVSSAEKPFDGQTSHSIYDVNESITDHWKKNIKALAKTFNVTEEECQRYVNIINDFDYEDMWDYEDSRSLLFSRRKEENTEKTREKKKREDRYTPLHHAAREGDIDAVQRLLREGVDVNQTGTGGFTALYLAAQQGQTDVVITLLESGADKDVNVGGGFTPLHISAQQCHTDIVMTLLENGADINVSSEGGITPLHLSAELGNSQITQALLKENADVNKADEGGITPLHKAAENGHADIMNTLIEAGATLNTTDKDGTTPLHAAVVSGNAYAVATLLEQQHADVNNADNLGTTPLHIAAKKGYTDIAAILLKKGADVKKTRKDGITPLHLSAQEGHTDMVHMLIENGADINATLENGITPLYLAAYFGRTESVQALLKAGADVHKTTEENRTPLHMAAQEGHTDIVTMLIENGANVIQANAKGLTPLHSAVISGNTDTIQVLLDKNADVNTADENGITPLDLAVKAKQGEIVKTLLVQPSMSPESIQHALLTKNTPAYMRKMLQDKEKRLAGDQAPSVEPRPSSFRDRIRPPPEKTVTLEAYTNKAGAHR